MGMKKMHSREKVHAAVFRRFATVWKIKTMILRKKCILCGTFLLQGATGGAENSKRLNDLTMNAATKIKDLGSPPWAGSASAYRLDPPVEHDGTMVQFVVVSGSTKPPGPPEVAVFACTPDGDVEDIGDRLAKVRDSTDHAEALLALGYRAAL
jgi:hypothetical protein